MYAPLTTHVRTSAARCVRHAEAILRTQASVSGGVLRAEERFQLRTRVVRGTATLFCTGCRAGARGEPFAEVGPLTIGRRLGARLATLSRRVAVERAALAATVQRLPASAAEIMPGGRRDQRGLCRTAIPAIQCGILSHRGLHHVDERVHPNRAAAPADRALLQRRATCERNSANSEARARSMTASRQARCFAARCMSGSRTAASGCITESNDSC
jgi:hypothetical protein